ncbi:MAG: hypothetical protein ACXAC7_14245, partial [Candidatus Hodarchaeales archaeon]
MFSRFEMWKISKLVYGEIFYRTQIASSGAQKIKFLEKYEKNITSARRTIFLYNFFSSILFLSAAVYPLLSIKQLLTIQMTDNNLNALVFINSSIFTLYFVLLFLYLFLFGIMYLVSFMKGDVYIFLRSYPLSKSEIHQLTFFTIIRMFTLQIIVILVVVPIGGFILTLSPLILILLLINNLILLCLIFYSLIIMSYIISQKVYQLPEKSIWVNSIMIGSVILYIATLIPIMAGTQLITNFLNNLYTSDTLPRFIEPELNLILSLILFPMSSNYFVTLFLFPFGSIPRSLLITSFIGTLILCAFTLFILRKGSQVITTIAYNPKNGNYTRQRITEVQDVNVSISHPSIAFLKKSLKLLSREYGSLSYFFLGICFPLVLVYSFFIVPRYSNSLSINNYFSFLTIILIFTVLFLNE